MPYPCPCGRRNEPARKAGECRYAGGCCLFLAEARRAPYGPANRGKAAACRFLRRSPALLAAFPVFERPLFACQTARAGPSSKNGMPQFQAASLQKQRRFWRALSSCVSRKAKPVHPQSRRLPRRGIAFRPCGRVQRLRSGSRMKVAPPRASCAKPDGSCGTALLFRPPERAVWKPLALSLHADGWGALPPLCFPFCRFLLLVQRSPAALCKKRDALFAIPPVTSPFANGRAAGAPEPFFAARSLPAGQRPFRTGRAALRGLLAPSAPAPCEG